MLLTEERACFFLGVGEEGKVLRFEGISEGGKCGMFSWLARIVSACLRPVRRYARMSKDDGGVNGGDGGDFDGSSTVGSDDALVWYRDLEKHSCGEFSFAVVQANEVIEDHSQVETGSDAVFVGVYDGHGGPEASRYINDHLFHNLMSESS